MTATHLFSPLVAVLWVEPEQWVRAVSLRDHNTRVVVLGAAILGIAAGVIGSFTLLRKRALMGDALSHATLPGIAGAFIIATLLGSTQKSLLVLLAGAATTGVLGVAVLLLLRRYTRLKEDTVLGVVLSVFFGAGAAMLKLVEQLGTGSSAGLESFIYGKTASMVPQDVWLIALSAVLIVGVCVLLYKEFKLLSFDPAYASCQGWPVVWLDVAMMGLVVLVTVIGLQAVGLILVIALLIIPAAAARFWSDRMSTMTLIAGGIGGASATVGALLSAIYASLPSGAVIVLVAAAVFLVSMLVGRARGVLPRMVRRGRLTAKVGRQHLLRAVYEATEGRGGSGGGDAGVTRRFASLSVGVSEVLGKRSWSRRRLAGLLRKAEGAGLVTWGGGDSVAFTAEGVRSAARVVRNHRLWEMYLIRHADIAPSHVDRDADMIEHVLSPAMIAELEDAVADRPAVQPHREEASLPASPHPLGPPAAAVGAMVQGGAS